MSADVTGRSSSKVEYCEQELPLSILQAIRIIERLLTQAQFHEQHVQYKAYPSAKIEKKDINEEEEEEENKANLKRGFGRK